MRWAIFCKVIDNLGDVGVCWRLASDLAARGERVDLWIDDASALAWMAPHGAAGVDVVPWRDGPAAPGCQDARPDVLIEAFGCDPAPCVLAAAFEHAPAGGPRPVWINLEYLSAEPYVERLHRLPSPVFRGAGAGATKYFFYPGFTARTGGLLREPDLMARREHFDRAQWLARQGIDWHGERLISLFCYAPESLGPLLAQLEQGTCPTLLLVTAGLASRALPPGPSRRGALTIVWLPYLPQHTFDELLWACDLNFVRGEDSLVRALWAGAPFIWHIYPQDDLAHHAKLHALLDRLDAPASLRQAHASWNSLDAASFPMLNHAVLHDWEKATRRLREGLLGQEDLTSQLIGFVAQKS